MQSVEGTMTDTLRAPHERSDDSPAGFPASSARIVCQSDPFHRYWEAESPAARAMGQSTFQWQDQDSLSQRVKRVSSSPRAPVYRAF